MIGPFQGNNKENAFNPPSSSSSSSINKKYPHLPSMSSLPESFVQNIPFASTTTSSFSQTSILNNNTNNNNTPSSSSTHPRKLLRISTTQSNQPKRLVVTKPPTIITPLRSLSSSSSSSSLKTTKATPHLTTPSTTNPKKRPLPSVQSNDHLITSTSSKPNNYGDSNLNSTSSSSKSIADPPSPIFNDDFVIEKSSLDSILSNGPFSERVNSNNPFSTPRMSMGYETTITASNQFRRLTQLPSSSSSLRMSDASEITNPQNKRVSLYGATRVPVKKASNPVSKQVSRVPVQTPSRLSFCSLQTPSRRSTLQPSQMSGFADSTRRLTFSGKRDTLTPSRVPIKTRKAEASATHLENESKIKNSARRVRSKTPAHSIGVLLQDIVCATPTPSTPSSPSKLRPPKTAVITNSSPTKQTSYINEGVVSRKLNWDFLNTEEQGTQTGGLEDIRFESLTTDSPQSKNPSTPNSPHLPSQTAVFEIQNSREQNRDKASSSIENENESGSEDDVEAELVQILSPSNPRRFSVDRTLRRSFDSLEPLSARLNSTENETETINETSEKETSDNVRGSYDDEDPELIELERGLESIDTSLQLKHSRSENPMAVLLDRLESFRGTNPCIKNSVLPDRSSGNTLYPNFATSDFATEVCDFLPSWKPLQVTSICFAKTAHRVLSSRPHNHLIQDSQNKDNLEPSKNSHTTTLPSTSTFTSTSTSANTISTSSSFHSIPNCFTSSYTTIPGLISTPVASTTTTSTNFTHTNPFTYQRPCLPISTNNHPSTRLYISPHALIVQENLKRHHLI